jgi:type IV secretory pathway protease TraF
MDRIVAVIVLNTPRPQRSPHVQALCCRSTVVLVLILGGLLVSTRFLVLNIEPSVPLGLYRLGAVPAHLTKGMLVRLHAPPVMAPWHARWLDLLKPIAALPGDQVCVLSVGLWINGEPYGKVYAEAHGKQLPRIRGCWVVPEGSVFLGTKTVGTIDSRYFGSVPVTDLTASARPVWTWR